MSPCMMSSLMPRGPLTLQREGSRLLIARHTMGVWEAWAMAHASCVSNQSESETDETQSWEPHHFTVLLMRFDATPPRLATFQDSSESFSTAQWLQATRSLFLSRFMQPENWDRMQPA